jgi:aldehyde:ferredoxin oxidoreductase
MATAGGYMNKMVLVNLSDTSIAEEALPDEHLLRKFIGGTGLGLYYLWREAPPNFEPTDERAPIIFMTGPLTGTGAPSSANYTTVCLNFDVPYAAGVGHSHGFWGAYLKFAGYDGIIIKGKSPAPVYLLVDDGSVKIRDARHLWGQDTRETERLIKQEIGGDPDKTSVACIGPGGEAILHGGMVKNDRNHGAGKGSPGSIMGSKKLKAIAVRGTKGVPIAHSEDFINVTSEWEAKLFSQPSSPEKMWAAVALKDAGQTRHYSNFGYAHWAAVRNLTDPSRGLAYTSNYVQALGRWQVTPKPSYNCKIACAYNVYITDGPYAGYTVSLCGGGENMEGAAGMVGVEDAGATLVLTDYYDAMGLDAANAGAVVAMAFEAYEKGLITNEDTGGLELRWGNDEAAMQLVQQMIAREGLGQKLAAGLGKAAEAIAKDKGSLAGQVAKKLRGMTVHVKGAGINLHDFRIEWGTLLGQIVSPAGPGWHAPGADFLSHEPDVGYDTKPAGIALTPEQARAKALEVRNTQRKKLWDDTTGVCWFAALSLPGIVGMTARSVAAAVGWENFDAEEALRVGERIATLMRLIAVKRGFTKRHDFDVSPRLLEAPSSGPGQGKSMAPHLEQMVDEYYRLMDFDLETGSPNPDALARLGLDQYA